MCVVGALALVFVDSRSQNLAEVDKIEIRGKLKVLFGRGDVTRRDWSPHTSQMPAIRARRHARAKVNTSVKRVSFPK